MEPININISLNLNLNLILLNPDMDCLELRLIRIQVLAVTLILLLTNKLNKLSNIMLYINNTTSKSVLNLIMVESFSLETCLSIVSGKI